MNTYSQYKKIAALSLSLTMLVLSSCKDMASVASAKSAANADEISDAAVEAINGAAAAQGLTAFYRAPLKSQPQKQLFDMLITPAEASTCALGDGANAGVCSSSAKTVTYNCDIGSSSWLLTGTSTLTYSNAGCSFGAHNTSVTRTTNLQMDRAGILQLNVSSNSATDYRGNTFGGGQTIAVSNTGVVSLSVAGIHRSATAFSATLFDIMSRTTTPFTVSGVVLGSMTINGGALEVVHNKAKYFSTWSANGVHWGDTNCSCPTSGVLNGVLSGSVTGSMSLVFSSTCGEVISTVNGVSSELELDTCHG